MKLGEIKKLAKQTGFFEELETIDFSAGPSSFWLYRDRGEFLDVLSVSVYSTGSFFEVAVVCFKKELIDHCDMDLFPKGFYKHMRIISELYVSETKGLDSSTAWSCKSESEAITSLQKIAIIIKESADPWFQRITSDSAFFDSIAKGLRNREWGINLASKLNL